MRLAVSCFCILHLGFVLVSAGVFTRNDLQAEHRNLSSSSSSSSSSSTKAQTSPSAAGSLNHGRHRPLFARRGQYERQKIHILKPKEVPAPPNDPAPPPKPKPVKPSCSQLTQSCVPQSGCCDPCASCHCRFFNAICFCRKTNSHNEKKAAEEQRHTKREI